MALSDPISDLLTRIRNGRQAKHRFVDIPLSKMNRAIVDILMKKGYVSNILENEEKRKIRVFLRYHRGNREAFIQGLKRVSRPGVRYYVGYKEIPSILNGLGSAILSTPKGVLDGDEARHQKVGGELLCYVW